jgi:hypothetical protein
MSGLTARSSAACIPRARRNYRRGLPSERPHCMMGPLTFYRYGMVNKLNGRVRDCRAVADKERAQVWGRNYL